MRSTMSLRKNSTVVQNFPKNESIGKRYRAHLRNNKIPKFVYLGTISEDRGAIKMVLALDAAFGRNNYELNYLGDITNPILERKLQRIFKDSSCIRYHGFVPMSEAWKVCQSCDVGLAILDPRENYMESYPTKLFEYLVCGLPVITSNFLMYRDLVSHPNVGFCIDPNNDAELARACRSIINPSVYSQFSSNIASFPFHDFTWENEFGKFLDYLRQS